MKYYKDTDSIDCQFFGNSKSLVVSLGLQVMHFLFLSFIEAFDLFKVKVIFYLDQGHLHIKN